MSTTEWQRLWAAFHQVLEAEAGERTALLAALPSGLRQQVEELLAAHHGSRRTR